jgi:hypothetical protein
MSGTTGLIWILISRMFAGICGANLSVASAYIADISPPEKRSARMGLIGMAFGLGFIFGPAIGAFSLEIFGQQTGARLGRRVFLRREFHPRLVHPRRKPPAEFRARRAAPESEPVVAHARAAETRPAHRRFFLATFCFTCFESTFPLLVPDINLR